MLGRKGGETGKEVEGGSKHIACIYEVLKHSI